MGRTGIQAYSGYIQYMRSILITLIVFVLLGLTWVFYTPVLAYRQVRLLGTEGADQDALQAELLRERSAAVPALRDGLQSGSPGARIQCAYLLASQNDPVGEEYLLRMLREQPKDELGSSAEHYLLSVWKQHDTPEASVLTRVLRNANRDYREMALLNETLTQHPEWMAGYIQRARLYLDTNDPYLARRDAVTALMIEPHEFEAMVILAESYMSINSPEQAYLCLQQALKTNPRLQDRLQEQIHTVLRSLDLQKARKRQEHRKATPLA